MGCPERDRLAEAVNDSLERIVKLTQEQLVVFRKGVLRRFEDLDRELEHAVGEKERRVGALREHEREHGCLSRTARE